MIKIGKCAFVLAPICLFISFFADNLMADSPLRAVFIVLATVFLILAVVGKILESRSHPKEDSK